MKIDSISSAEKILQEYIPKVSIYSGDNMTLDRMWPLLEALNNPQDKLKVIHVAGTSGKTSTSYYIAQQLIKSGKKIGLTVSPHVDKITERVQINGKPVSDKRFCKDLGIFLDLVSKSGVSPSYFELLIAFVYWVFDKEAVDYAVIETGMGGLLDGTNVAQREDKVCVITDIGFDHMHILGNTLSEIAQQKAGIIHNNNSVYAYDQNTEIDNTIRTRSQEMSAHLKTFNFTELEGLKTEVVAALPDFQKRNWLLAEEVTKSIANRDNFTYVPVHTSRIGYSSRKNGYGSSTRRLYSCHGRSAQRTKDGSICV
jgi:dihydrofolate synthase / folylpolyglutamate synthase